MASMREGVCGGEKGMGTVCVCVCVCVYVCVCVCVRVRVCVCVCKEYHNVSTTQPYGYTCSSSLGDFLYNTQGNVKVNDRKCEGKCTYRAEFPVLLRKLCPILYLSF